MSCWAIHAGFLLHALFLFPKLWESTKVSDSIAFFSDVRAFIYDSFSMLSAYPVSLYESLANQLLILQMLKMKDIRIVFPSGIHLCGGIFWCQNNKKDLSFILGCMAEAGRPPWRSRRLSWCESIFGEIKRRRGAFEIHQCPNHVLSLVYLSQSWDLHQPHKDFYMIVVPLGGGTTPVVNVPDILFKLGCT